MNISSKHGKALDLSGAFLFLAIALAGLAYLNLLLAFGAVFIVLAFIASYMAWVQKEAGDDLGFVSLRAWAFFLALPGLLLLAVRVVLWIMGVSA